jgi:hypothetical protein
MTLMIVFRRHAALWALVTALCLPTAALRADTFSVLAFDNGTIQPGGARMFNNGKRFMNIEGIHNNNFASFAVADFSSGNLVNSNGNMMPSTPTGINAVTITLTQANASFTNAGSLNFYLAEGTTTSIQPNDAAVIFDATDNEGLNGQLAPVHFLGSATFTGTYTPVDTSGTQDTFTFPPDSSTQLDSATVAYVLGVLTAVNPDGTVGGTLRVLVTPPDPDVSATYTGWVMSDGVTPNPAGPTLTLDVSFSN